MYLPPPVLGSDMHQEQTSTENNTARKAFSPPRHSLLIKPREIQSSEAYLRHHASEEQMHQQLGGKHIFYRACVMNKYGHEKRTLKSENRELDNIVQQENKTL